MHPISRWARLAISASIALACGMIGAPGLAQAPYPQKTIEIVVPYPPGNAADVVARLISDRLGQRLGKPVIIQNRPGMSGGLGTQSVARAEPDGYTLLMGSTSFTLNPAVYAKLPYEMERDFAPVAVLTNGAGMLLIASPDLPANSVKELVELLRKDPERFNYAHIGRGSLQSLTMESFLATTGTKATAVSYKGSSQALTDLVGGRVDLMFDAPASSLAIVQSGKAKVLALSRVERSPLYPQLPSTRESGVPSLKDWNIYGWVGLLAPAKTPRPIVERLNKELMDIMHLPEVRKQVAEMKLEVVPPNSTAQAKEMLLADMRRWQEIATAAGMEKE
ncbi:tripartite tricarboxylate transporter substrate binding protein [Diaphorobacter sp. HDW4A]|uniref:Bug family tripartite tricarboxylate transporter substrate binding protein n=1 Tax=Diaphorobacter sp. HDW4A TaxID=2714924 RepID=UPI00140DB7D2|nr:tripartite tricarboxylate transporter substrate binding protein [Diaphorobacter sp. HDW4A]QIL80018.1 tripartite tricarboxylate transporter substrate binding protein [Diaphorobacter sp. HDW4A]